MNFCISTTVILSLGEESHTFLKKGTPKTFIEFFINRIPRGVVFVSSGSFASLEDDTFGVGRNPAFYRTQSRLWRVWNPQLVAVWNRRKVPYGIHATHGISSPHKKDPLSVVSCILSLYAKGVVFFCLGRCSPYSSV